MLQTHARVTASSRVWLAAALQAGNEASLRILVETLAAKHPRSLNDAVRAAGAAEQPKLIEKGGYKALLTKAQLVELMATRGGFQYQAKEKLLKFDPDFQKRNGDNYAAHYWTSKLPNVAKYGC